MSDQDRYEPRLHERHNLRPPRDGYYAWNDRDDDIEAALEPYGDHPSIVATLSFVRDNGMHGGIHIDYSQAQEIIDWLTARLGEREAPDQQN